MIYSIHMHECVFVYAEILRQISLWSNVESVYGLIMQCD